MHEKTHIPVFVSVVSFLLGCFDLVRGFMHTIFLRYSATHVAGLDLSTNQAEDLLRLLGAAFGSSNYMTGIMLILMALRARALALIMLAVIPLSNVIGRFGFQHALAPETASSTTVWGGLSYMMIDMYICVTTFVLGLAVMIYRKQQEK